MKIYFMTLLSLLLLSHNTPKSKKEMLATHPVTRINKKSAASCKCGPTLTIHATLPILNGNADILKIIVLNTSTGHQTVYPTPTSDILYPQDGGFTYVITYVFNNSKFGWNLYYFNTTHTECANVDFNGTRAAISFNTLCENYEVGPSDGWHTLC